MYQYDPSTGGIPTGFSAINLSVKCAAAAQAAAQMKSGGPPTSPGGTVMDLSTSSVTSTSPQVYMLSVMIDKHDQNFNL